MLIKEIKKTIELSKTGNPYARVLVRFEEYKDGKGNMTWVSGFGNKRTWAWKVGEDVAPAVTENNGYYNFVFDDTEENRLDVYQLPATIGFVMALLKPQNKTGATTPSKPKADGDEVKAKDIPF